MELNKIIQGNSLEVLKTLPDNSIDCCITSPPYYGLRDYGIEKQIGLEETPELFIETLAEIFAEVKRILKNSGTLWLNIGDSYAGSGIGTNDYRTEGSRSLNKTSIMHPQKTVLNKLKGCKPKDLIGVPWMLAFALRANGWYLRSDIIWNKPNPMPESVNDRPTKAHEYIFLMTKNVKYFYDAEAIKTPSIEPDDDRGSRQNRKRFPTDKINGIRNSGIYPMANKRTVWTVNTMPYADAHFATFPEDLITDCIKAGCPEFVCNKCGKPREKILEKEPIIRKRPEHFGSYREINGQPHPSKAGVKVTELGLTDCGCNVGFSPGIVLDPFSGAGTTALVSRKLHRNFVGIELNPEYIEIANKRLSTELGMFQ